jgi:hypothetical protein
MNGIRQNAMRLSHFKSIAAKTLAIGTSFRPGSDSPSMVPYQRRLGANPLGVISADENQ